VTVRDLQQQLAVARQQAEDARAVVAKSEADLEDLSGAYNTLEAHAFKLEGQLRSQQTGACCPRCACGTACTATCPFIRLRHTLIFAVTCTPVCTRLTVPVLQRSRVC